VFEHLFVSEPAILHADLDSFYASVEQRDDVRLRGRPVIVGGGVVLAASYEAKAYGVRTAMGGGLARRLCPRAVVVPPRFAAYTAASRAVFEVFRDTSPLVEGISIDEAFLDVGGLRRIAGPAPEIAACLRREVAERVGLPITVGVARTKFLAKVASRVAKPDGLLVVPVDGERAFLHPLPVGMLWGVGRVTADLVKEVRARLDLAGHERVKIVVSGGMDIDRIAYFKAAEAPIDSFAVGSAISDAPSPPSLLPCASNTIIANTGTRGPRSFAMWIASSISRIDENVSSMIASTPASTSVSICSASANRAWRRSDALAIPNFTPLGPTADWRETITPSGNATLTCHAK